MKISRTRVVVAVAALLVGSVLVPLAAGSAGAVTQPGVASTRLPVPAGAVDSGQPIINSISCGGSGFCVAVGQYYVPVGSSGQGPAGLIETWSGGVWTAMRAPVPAGGSGVGSLAGVSCSGSTCAAYGTYYAGSQTPDYMGLIRSGTGTWTAAAVLPPANDTFVAPSSGSIQAVNGVGCSGPGACELVGNGLNASSQGRAWAAGLQNGAWVAHETNTPIDATGQASWLHAIACGGGVCQAVGGYISSVGPEPLVVTVNPDGSTNSPPSHVPIPQNSTEISDVNGVACDSGGACAAYGVYYTSGGSNAESMVMPVGGTGFQPQGTPTATPESTTYFPAGRVYGDACASGACAFVGYYYDASNVYHPLLDRFGSSGLSTSVAPNDIVPTGVACGSAVFCTTQTVSPYGAPLDVLTSSGWVEATLTLPADQIAFALNSAQEQATACDSATSCWVLGDYPAASGTSQVGAAFADHVTPTPVAAPPTVSTSAMPTFALGSSAKFSWHGTAGSSPINHYTVEVRRSTWKSGFGSWSTPSGWAALSASASSVNVPLPVGDDTCVRVEAVDSAHLVSAWSSVRCTARPLDDRALSATSAWRRLKASGYYFGTYTSTKTYGATMTLASAQFDRLALIATKCASCGKVAIYSGSTLLTTINLYHSTTEKRVLIALSRVSLRTTNIRLRVVTSGKTVQIDGLGVSRT